MSWSLLSALVREPPATGLASAPLEFGFQTVEEQRVDEPVDVLDGRVMHASLAPFVMAEGFLHEGTEDDGADAAPVEAFADFQQSVTQFLG